MNRHGLFHAAPRKHIAIRSLYSTDCFGPTQLSAGGTLSMRRMGKDTYGALRISECRDHITNGKVVAMVASNPSALGRRNRVSPAFEIGDRVRLRLHPKWEGTVAGRSLSAYAVEWDDHGIETTHGELLELVAARESRAAG